MVLQVIACGRWLDKLCCVTPKILNHTLFLRFQYFKYLK